MKPIAIALLALVVLSAPVHAQTYSRCVDASGRVYLTDGPPPSGVRCAAQAVRELKESPVPAGATAPLATGQYALWMTEASGVIRLRAYPGEAACREAREARLADVSRHHAGAAYLCLPGGQQPAAR
jgi:hypothetical protein